MGNKLELTWYGKEKEIKVEPRILIEDKEKSNIKNDPNTENMLIHGDNLIALKAIENKYAGQIKCIYIDPPYNIAAANPYYDDNLENSEWLNLIRPRIEILWNLLSEDGLLAVQIDDEQFARLFLLMTEICGQSNMKIVCVKMSEATGVKMASVNRAKSIAKLKEFIILGKKDGIRNLYIEKIPKDKWDEEYKIWVEGVTKEELEELKEIMDDDAIDDNTIRRADNIASKIHMIPIKEIFHREKIKEDNIYEFRYENAWRIMRDVAVTGAAKKLADLKRDSVDGESFLILTPRGKKYLMKKDYNKEASQPRCKLLFADQYLTLHAGDLWTDIKTTGLDNEGVVDFPNGKKPEKLVKRIIQMNTSEGDIVLDSFLGSGTTSAVAHKMNRRWIGIEMGEHAYTHSKVRLDYVIQGKDNSGISSDVNWKGGGGYRFYELAPSLINEDDFGEYVINKDYNADMLAAAVALHEGFEYNPDSEVFWKQSKANESSYLFVTTKHLNELYLDSIISTMEENEYLIIACKSFDGEIENKYPNITIKKIPQMLLSKCEFDRDNYNLNIINPPTYEDSDEYEEEDDE